MERNGMLFSESVPVRIQLHFRVEFSDILLGRLGPEN